MTYFNPARLRITEQDTRCVRSKLCDKQKALEEALMKRLLLQTMITVVVWLVSVSLAEAININLAEVQNGLAVVQGNKAERNAAITWETGNVGQTTNCTVLLTSRYSHVRFSQAVHLIC